MDESLERALKLAQLVSAAADKEVVVTEADPSPTSQAVGGDVPVMEAFRAAQLERIKSKRKAKKQVAEENKVQFEGNGAAESAESASVQHVQKQLDQSLEQLCNCELQLQTAEARILELEQYVAKLEDSTRKQTEQKPHKDSSQLAAAAMVEMQKMKESHEALRAKLRDSTPVRDRVERPPEAGDGNCDGAVGALDFLEEKMSIDLNGDGELGASVANRAPGITQPLV